MPRVGDDRFSRFSTDPKFLSVARKDKKVNVDKRFGALFQENGNFSASEYSADARGRPKIISKSKKCNYKTLYHIQNSDHSPVSNTSYASGEEKTIEGTIKNTTNSKLLDTKVDYARGEANLYSSSSSDEESSTEDSSDDDPEEPVDETVSGDDQQWDKWGELDHDAEYTKESTNRIAVCNMDWDRVDAQDIFIAMSSFCPSGSAGVKSVRIYKSLFGKTRMAEEEKLGPKELRGIVEPTNEKLFSENDDVKDLDKKAMERVRKYQISRLKYFYAVVDFDSVCSANTVYNACDGVEYELSATRFDLRFIPSETEFDDEPTSSCESTTDLHLERYRPKIFSNTALALGKVELTWDEVDHERAKAMRRAFSEAELEDESSAAAMKYIAMSSDDENSSKEEYEYKNAADEGEFNTPEGEFNTPEGAINKYKALLTGMIKRPCNNVEEEEEAKFEISLGTEDVIKRGCHQKDAKRMTPWEQYLHRKREISKIKRKEKKKLNQPGDTDISFSKYDSTDNNKLEDSNCNEELEDVGEKAEGKRQKNRRKRGVDGKNTKASSKLEPQELSLLTMDDEDEQKHFDYQDILSKSKEGKKKRRKIDEKPRTSDHFNLDLNDQRFSAVFHNPEFNVDPSNPHFKKTKSMQDIVDEKQRRAAKDSTHKRKGDHEKRLKLKMDKNFSALSKSSKSLELLVKAVKNKT